MTYLHHSSIIDRSSSQSFRNLLVPSVKASNTTSYRSSVSSVVSSVEFLCEVNRSFVGKLSRACSSVESRAMLQARVRVFRNRVRFNSFSSVQFGSVRFSSVLFVVQLSTKLSGVKRVTIVQVL